MITREQKKLLLLLVTDIILLSIAHAINNVVLILVALVYFVIIILMTKKENFILCMLFFLPWSPIMKFSPGTFTWFTIIVPLFFIFHTLFTKTRWNFHKINVLLVSSIVIFTLVSKIILGYTISLNYIMFMFSLLFIPTYFNQYKQKISFETAILFFSIGIILACFISGWLTEIPHMLNYIDVYELESKGLVRLSGFYGDANFYAAHILTSLAGIYVILLKNKKSNKVLLFSILILLLYCGFLSVSKMFLLTALGMSMVWLIITMISNNSPRLKLGLIILLVFVVAFIINSGIFDQQLEMYITRFSGVDDLSGLTTGRSDIISNYINYFKNNLYNLFFGQGFTNVLYEVNKASHNTIIQGFYQFGIIGMILLISWVLQQRRIMNEKPVYMQSQNKYLVLLLLVGCFLPWLALDIIYFDEFFYITFLFFIGKNYIYN